MKYKGKSVIAYIPFQTATNVTTVQVKGVVIKVKRDNSLIVRTKLGNELRVSKKMIVEVK